MHIKKDGAQESGVSSPIAIAHWACSAGQINPVIPIPIIILSYILIILLSILYINYVFVRGTWFVVSAFFFSYF